MRVRVMLRLCFLVLFFALGISLSNAQWGPPYANSWVDFSRQYYKVEVKKEGVYQIPFANLPKDLQAGDMNKLQLFRNGVEVSIIFSNSDGVTFYGVPNTGSTDSLLYRPMSSRVNPYSSLFSSTSAYYLSLGKQLGKRSRVLESVSKPNITAVSSHREEMLILQEGEYSLSTSSAIHPKFMNSFYENGASKSGVKFLGDSLITSSFNTSKMARGSVSKPSLELLFHGRSYFTRTLEVSVGKDAKSLRKIGEISIVDFQPKFFNAVLEFSDFSDTGQLTIGYKSKEKDRLERVSLTYFKLEYDQSIEFGSEGSKFLNWTAKGSELLRIKIDNAPVDAAVFDVTIKESPALINGGSKDFTFETVGGKRYRLYVSRDRSLVNSDQIVKVNFLSLKPADYNYLIVTNDNLFASAKQFADYRASVSGGAYKTLVVNIKDIYNQFNYGEVSPVAIRRFVDYMLSDGNKEKYLFLIGTSTTYVERMKPELAGDVPTIGYPGSDVLLVAGLAGEEFDAPAIPVGRLSAFQPAQVISYLKKLKEYENASITDLGWRKNTLHINGGKTVEEISSFSNDLETLAPLIRTSSFGGQIKRYVKQSLIEVEDVDISKDVNRGVGLITYVGHGAQTVTDLDFGYVSPEDKNFSNSGKYPLMYFNGCGVGNIFNDRLNPDLNTSDKIPLSLDWLLTPDKGAISIIANSFESFVSPSLKYLGKLYETLFADADSENLSIGKVQKNAIKKVLASGNVNYYDIANIHQSLLNGDPAIHLLHVAKPDYAMNDALGISILSKKGARDIISSDTLQIKIPVSNLGRYNKSEAVAVNLKLLFIDGSSKSLDRLFSSWPYSDTLFFKIPNYGRSLTQLVVKLDKENIINELKEENNSLGLEINWDVAEKNNTYSIANSADIVSPQVEVKFNGSLVSDYQALSPAPKISLRVTDDRFLEYHSSMVNFFIKNCYGEDCEFKEIKIDTANSFRLTKLSDRSFQVDFSANGWFKTGEYQLLVRAKDIVGNISKSYLIRFKIEDRKKAKIVVVAGPNPSTSYVKFTADIRVATPIEKVLMKIFDLHGVIQFENEIYPDVSDVLEVYWNPPYAFGLYVYNFTFAMKDKTTQDVKGKIMLYK